MMIRNRTSWIPSLTILFCVLLNYLLFAYQFGVDAHIAQIIPFIHRLADASLYPSDPYVATLPLFPSIYPLLMAWLSHSIELERLHFILYIGLRILWFSTIYQLAAQMFGRRRTAVLACTLAAMSPLANALTPLGEDPMIKSSLYQTTLIAPFLLLAISRFLGANFLSAFAILGVTFYFNAVAAAPVAIIFLAASLIAEQRRQVLKGWLFLGVILLSGAWWYVHRLAEPGTQETIAILKMWYPGHYFPSLWTAHKWLRLLCQIPLLAFFYWAALPRCPTNRVIKSFLGAIAVMWIFAWLGEVVSWPTLVTAQLFRSDAIFCVLGLVCAADWIAGVLEQPGLGAAALGALVISAFSEIHAPVFIVTVLALIMVRKSAPKWTWAAATIGLLVCLGSLCGLSAQPWTKALAYSFLFIIIVAARIKDCCLRVAPARILAITVALSLLPLAPVINWRLSHPSPELLSASDADWRQVQEWARANTPKDAVFFVPLFSQGFRVFSERSPVVDWTDAAAVHWSPTSGREWLSRIADLRHTESLGPGPQLSNLAAKYHAGYLVAPRSRVFAGHALYANSEFVVYGLNDPVP